MPEPAAPQEGGHSCPLGGLESPPPFFDPHQEIDRHERRLPHWQQGAVFYFVTWRLADALPADKLAGWMEEKKIWLRLHPAPWNETTEREFHHRFTQRMEEWLDAGSGSCVLRNPGTADIVYKAFLHFDGQRYSLSAFVVMPNHVHVLFRLHASHPLEEVVKSWKGFTAWSINRRLGTAGKLWQEEYWDRMIRNDRHLSACQHYIRENPRKARLRDGEFALYEAPPEGGHSCPPGGLENPPSF